MKIIVIILLCTNFYCCAARQNVFYDGLRRKAETENATPDSPEKTRRVNEALLSFDEALDSPNRYTRQAAAEEILDMLFEGHTISAYVLTRAQREASPSWAAAFDVLNAAPSQTREKALAYFLGTDTSAKGGVFSGAFPDNAALYALRECRSRGNFFTPAEDAAIDGHFAALRSRFAEALDHFRVTQETPPELFFRYPELLNSLGRSFQYAGTDAGEIALLLEWEKKAGQINSAPENAAAGSGDIRFRLLFFAGRIARQRGRLDEAVALFENALPFAPDTTQQDACIWYILDSALERGFDIPEKFAALIPRRHDAAYFDDVMDELIFRLAARRRWKDIAAIFPLVCNYAHNAAVAKYAYVAGRALEAGLFSAEEAGEAAGTVRSYLETAYRSGGFGYYRAQSAAALGKPFLELPLRAPPERETQSAALEFLRGFFNHDAADCAPAYITALAAELTPACKRSLARVLNEAGLYADSIRLISSVLEHDDCALVREDLELAYPRPFRELTEKYAHEYNIAPELLFALIRTESAFQSGIISHAGAIGLTQLMPATAEETAERIRRRGGPDYTPIDTAALQNSEVNIHIGAAYLRYLLDRMESPLLSLLAYNGGVNRVRRWHNAATRVSAALGEDLFLETIEYRETREYGRKVIAAASVYRALYYDGQL